MTPARKRLAAAIAVAFACTAFPATAQQAQRVEKIEVTGSNIKRVDQVAAPVQVITREQIERANVNHRFR